MLATLFRVFAVLLLVGAIQQACRSEKKVDPVPDVVFTPTALGLPPVQQGYKSTRTYACDINIENVHLNLRPDSKAPHKDRKFARVQLIASEAMGHKKIELPYVKEQPFFSVSTLSYDLSNSYNGKVYRAQGRDLSAGPEWRLEREVYDSRLGNHSASVQLSFTTGRLTYQWRSNEVEESISGQCRPTSQP